MTGSVSGGTGVPTGRVADRRRSTAALVGGLSGLAAGACWIGKGAAVLATGAQPPVLFELAPLLMAVTVCCLAGRLPPSPGRALGAGAGGAGVAAGLVVLAGEAVALPPVVTGTGMAVAHLAVLVGLAVSGNHLRREQGHLLPLALAVMTVPAVLAGGVLSVLAGERALELPIVALGVAWLVLGRRLVRRSSAGSAVIAGENPSSTDVGPADPPVP